MYNSTVLQWLQSRLKLRSRLHCHPVRWLQFHRAGTWVAVCDNGVGSLEIGEVLGSQAGSIGILNGAIELES